MCIGANEPGGPRRCSADAASRSARTGAAATRAAAYADALSVECAFDEAHLNLLELQRKAVMGEPLTDEEQAMLRAGATTTEPAAPGSEADYQEYAQQLRDLGIEPSSYSDYLATEHAAAQSYQEWVDQESSDRQRRADAAEEQSFHEWQADTASGYYLRMERADAVDDARAHAATLDLDEARSTLDGRVNSPEHQQLIAARDTAHAAEAAAEQQWDAVKDSGAVDAISAAHDRLYSAYCDRLIADDDLGAYANESAQYAARVGELSPQPTYGGDRIGECVHLGAPPAGSEAALALRQQGIHGSHIGAAAGIADPDSPHTTTSAKLSTIGAITDDDIAAAERAHTRHTGRAGRAAAWEQATAADYTAANPDVTVQAAPGVWQHPDRPWQTTEITAVTSSDGMSPDGVLLVKTATATDGYGDDVPPHVRAEAANALDATGLRHADVAVRIDDTTYRQYRIHRDEPLTGLREPATMPELRNKLDGRWQTWQTEKTNPPQKGLNSGTFAWTANPRSESGHAKNQAAAAELAAYRGISTTQAHDMISAQIAAGTPADTAIRGLYKSYNPAADRRRRFVVCDIETNSLSAGRGEIIQTGAVVMNGRGDISERIDELHGIDPRAARTIGTGAEHIHNIRYDQIHGRRTFANSQSRTRLNELLTDPNTTFVAHNAAFERSFLAANGVAADRVIDTMLLSRRFDHTSRGARLADFTASHGVEYRDAHNAYKDAHMTARALLGFWRDQHK
ncbi:exonuclease domain-containing protein [Prescottella subtropica]|uniref:exonuclease domain-containing protein n=1 Tax=Prescottella subtropica TaxID=2545757 RepID=UPI0010F872ED|nr:exonuclease domain-containing protein [Prescottella subtropica]